MAYIEFRDVVKRFGDNTVLDHINFGIQQGDLVTLLGPSGCGKSTLLRCLSGLESVSEGQIVLDGRDVTNVPASKRNIGMVFQQYSLFPNMTVEQNIGVGVLSASKEERAARVAEQVRAFRLDGLQKKRPAQLSGGQQQRVALARIMASKPELLLLDEPFSALDALTRADIRSWYVRTASELGMASVVITHDVDEAVIMASRVYVLEGDPRGGVPSTVAGEVTVNHQVEGAFDLSPEFLTAKREVLALLG